MRTINFVAIALCLCSGLAAANGIRVKDLARIGGDREISLVGYGLVVGLAGTGDSARNRATLQSLANTLRNFGMQVTETDLIGKNVASVMVTAELPPYAEPGDRINLRVSSTGDARSLSGGALLLAPLYGPDRKLYALGQGALTIGGYNVEIFDNIRRKNTTTVGQVTEGGIIERASPNASYGESTVNIVLKEPDYTTANRLVEEIKRKLNVGDVRALHPGKLAVKIPENTSPMAFIAELENLRIQPDTNARVVVNERTGTIVAGANVILGEVSIAHGDLRIDVDTRYNVSQPQLLVRPNRNIGTAVTPETKIEVTEGGSAPVQLSEGTTVGELVLALNQIHLSTRDIITILQSIEEAGALRAELIIQ